MSSADSGGCDRAAPPALGRCPRTTINDGKGGLKSWKLCDGLSEGVMGQGLATPAVV